MSNKVQFIAIEGDYGLVSLDIPCIQSILYAKFNKCPIDIVPLNTYKLCAFYKVPTLKYKDKCIDDFNLICNKLKNGPTNIDQDLTARQLSESLAIVNFVFQYLKPATEYLYWLDQRNFDEFIGPWFMKALPLPFNYLYTKRRIKMAEELIETMYPLDENLEVIKEFINKSTAECLQALSARLGESAYIHGDRPTSVDAIIYAYIAPALKLPFPSNEIGTLLTMWPNLIEFVKRIDSRYLADVKKDIKYLKKVDESKEDVSYVAIGILTVSVACLLVGFAFRKGIVNSLVT